MRILSLKTATGSPADGIDNFNQAIFGRLSDGRVTFYAEGTISEKGAIHKISSSRLDFLRREKPEIVWGNGHIKELGYVLIRPGSSRYILNFHTMLFRGNAPWNVRTPWIARQFIFNRADLIICPSEASAQSVRKYFPKKKVVSILNGVDIELFSPSKKDEAYLSEKYHIDFSQPVIAFVGSLHLRKRPDLFIKLAKEIPGANFVAVGRAVPEFDCSDAVRDLKNFQWVPAMPREDVAKFLASSVAFVFPSLNDASAAVILEAMSSGAVPIVSASGGSGEFFKNGESGFLIKEEPGEKAKFAEKISKLLTDAKLRVEMSQAARREAELHTWNVVARQYEDEILSL